MHKSSEFKGKGERVSSLRAVQFIGRLAMLLVGAVGLEMGSSTARAVLINNVDFTTVYTGDVVPNSANPAWTLSQNSGSGTVSSGIFTAASTLAGTRSYTINNTAIWDAASTGGGSTILGTTIEFSLKVDSVDSTATIATRFIFSNGSKQYTFNFLDGQITTTTAGKSTTIDTTTAFNTYRITLTPDPSTGAAGALASLYINGGATPAITGYAGGSSAANQVSFGDSSNTLGGTVEWDYIAFTNAGAFSPVPEPTTAGLFLAAGMGVLIFKRLQKRTA